MYSKRRDFTARERSLSSILALAAISVACSPGLGAQDAVPKEILDRTIYIKTPNGAGTAFKIEYQEKICLVTARHVVAGLPLTNAKIQVRDGERWSDLQLTRILFPPSPEADIAVLRTEEAVSVPFTIKMAEGGGGPTFGQKVWFLGYPLLEGIQTHIANKTLPFIKSGTMSAIDTTDQNAVVLYIDGFNNPGFSGGPILFWNFTEHAYRIVGVVKGYRNDTAKVLVNGSELSTNILVNSGILVGYSVIHVNQALDQARN